MAPAATKDKSIAKRRPAEAATGLAGIIVAVAALIGLDVSPAAAAAIAVLVGLIPTIVTGIVKKKEPVE
jgi:hypothetical protein